MKIRLVSYNVHKGVGTDRRIGLERIAEVVKHYDPHIVCLQEVIWAPVAEGHRTQPQALADAIGLPHSVIALNCHRKRGTYGNMTLSKFPIELHENLDVTLSFMKPRGVLYTQIRLPRAPLHLFNAHLGLTAFERLRQMRDLVDDTPRVAPPGEAVVYAGDMNDWGHKLYCTVLHTAGFRCAIGDADDPGHATFPSWYPVGALDKVFVRGAVHSVHAHPSRLALARIASDHLPVIADFEVDPR